MNANDALRLMEQADRAVEQHVPGVPRALRELAVQVAIVATAQLAPVVLQVLQDLALTMGRISNTLDCLHADLVHRGYSDPRTERGQQ